MFEELLIIDSGALPLLASIAAASYFDLNFYNCILNSGSNSSVINLGYSTTNADLFAVLA